MQLSLSQLAVLIELVEQEIIQRKENQRLNVGSEKETSNNEKPIKQKMNDELLNDNGEGSMQLLALSSSLSQLYQSKWTDDCNFPSYKKLIARLYKTNL
jgi:hypothetical protein